MNFFLTLGIVLACFAVVSPRPEGFEDYINVGAKGDFLQQNILADNADGKLTVPELIEKYGYPVESHEVITEDRYVLTVHRIPHSPKCGPGENKRVVYLQHGLLGDSSNWIIAGTEKGLAYNLADECYDVWMGNYRGTTYSRKHLDWHPIWNKKRFWAYSWDELGTYDIPATIDHILNSTGVDSIYYVGHSMGTTGFWVMCSHRPEYASKVRLMSAYAPIAYTENMISPISLIAPFANSIEWLGKMMGIYEFLPSTPFMTFIGQTVCHQKSLVKELCSNVLFLIAGYNTDQMDMDLLPTILGHVPAGSSVRNLVHYAQGVNHGKFRRYNHGSRAKNQKEYGVSPPPEYDLSKVTVPVAMYWGQNDWLATPKDTERLRDALPNVVRYHRVEHDRYNHLDFLWAKDNIDLLNRYTIDFMANY